MSRFRSRNGLEELTKRRNIKPYKYKHDAYAPGNLQMLFDGRVSHGHLYFADSTTINVVLHIESMSLLCYEDPKTTWTNLRKLFPTSAFRTHIIIQPKDFARLMMFLRINPPNKVTLDFTAPRPDESCVWRKRNRYGM